MGALSSSLGHEKPSAVVNLQYYARPQSENFTYTLGHDDASVVGAATFPEVNAKTSNMIIIKITSISP